MTRSISNFVGKATMQAFVTVALVLLIGFGFATDRVSADAIIAAFGVSAAFYFKGPAPKD